MIIANNFQISVKWRKSTTPNDPGTIYYQVVKNQCAKLVFTPYRIYEDEWDSKKERLKDSDNAERTIPLRVAQARIRFDLDRLRYCAENSTGLQELIKKYEALKSSNLFFSFMEDTVEHLIDLGQFTTAKNYISSYRSFCTFTKNYNLDFIGFASDLIEKYEAMMKLRKVKSNTSAFYLRNLRAVYYKAVDQELTSDKRPFRRVFTGTVKTMKRAISAKEILAIKSLDLSKRPSLDFARDAFLFSFYGRGMSMIDVAHVTSADIRGGYLFYHRSKTEQPLKVKVIPQMQAIINKYKSDNAPYLLPLIKNKGCQEDKEYDASIRRINNNLKKIAKLADISIPLSTYVARHSWASIGKTKNLPIAVISDSLGHDSLSTTEIYLKSIDQDAIDAANELVTKGL